MRKWIDLVESVAGETFYHGSSGELKPGLFPSDRPTWFTDLPTAKQYGAAYECRVRPGLKTAELTNRNDPAYDAVRDHFGQYPIERLLLDGELWQNKGLEQAIIDWLARQGYEKIWLPDRTDDTEHESVVIINPRENVEVVKRA